VIFGGSDCQGLRNDPRVAPERETWGWSRGSIVSQNGYRQMPYGPRTRKWGETYWQTSRMSGVVRISRSTISSTSARQTLWQLKGKGPLKALVFQMARQGVAMHVKTGRTQGPRTGPSKLKQFRPMDRPLPMLASGGREAKNDGWHYYG
jgi:hypothetical protein